jgi:glycosyltransferase involved in cell wall biosynthesis
MRKVLILSYFYPPIGGAGVQRTVKFAKFLPEFGFLPIVVAGRGFETGLPEDPTLLKEVTNIKTYNVHLLSIEKKLNNFLSGSLGRWTNTTLSGWMKAARRTMDEAIKEEKPDLLFVTTSPFSAARIISSIAIKYKIPWVLDMRDPWALDPISSYPTRFHFFYSLKNMKRACTQANAVIMNTPGAVLAAKKIFSDISPKKFYCIPNGWDKEDFHKIGRKINHFRKPMKIVHTGLFHTKGAIKKRKKIKAISLVNYSLSGLNLLTRTPNYLFAAYRKLIDEKKVKSNEVKFLFAGMTTEEDRTLVKNYKLESCVEFTGYLKHNQSMSLLQKADVLFLPLHEIDDNRDPLIVPGKTYEYMATGKPILACVPKGDAHDYVLKSGLGYISNPSDVDHIADVLFNLLEQHNTPAGIKTNRNDQFISKFERKRLTQKLSKVFENVCFSSD